MKKREKTETEHANPDLFERVSGMRRDRQPLTARDWMLLAKGLQERLADDLEQVTEDEDAVDTICDLCYAIDGLHYDAKAEEASP